MSRPALDLKEAIVHQPWGGLGDNLQFSTLPERFGSLGIRTLISTRNAVRNSEINSLVWGMNPFIDGVSDAEPNAGACRRAILDGLPMSLSFMERIETAHGLEPANRYPKIYYKPIPRPELSDAVIVDVDATAFKTPPALIADYLDYLVANYHYRREELLQAQFVHKVARNTHRIAGLATLKIASIFEYCDIIASCRALVTVHSGGQTLAVAVRGNKARPLIHCFCTPTQFNSRNYIWDGVEYYVQRKTWNAVASARRSWRIFRKRLR
jgi:hypothetical protein